MLLLDLMLRSLPPVFKDTLDAISLLMVRHSVGSMIYSPFYVEKSWQTFILHCTFHLRLV